MSECCRRQYQHILAQYVLNGELKGVFQPENCCLLMGGDTILFFGQVVFQLLKIKVMYDKLKLFSEKIAEIIW
jgi:hypothetical protein